MKNIKLKIPKRINILGEDWKIKLVDGWIRGKNNGQCHGTADFSNRVISVRNKGNILNVLCHEISHIARNWGIHQLEKEYFCNALAGFMEQLFTQVHILEDKNVKKGNSRSKQKAKRR